MILKHIDIETINLIKNPINLISKPFDSDFEVSNCSTNENISYKKQNLKSKMTNQIKDIINDIIIKQTNKNTKNVFNNDTFKSFVKKDEDNMKVIENEIFKFKNNFSFENEIPSSINNFDLSNDIFNDSYYRLNDYLNCENDNMLFYSFSECL